MWLSKSSIGGVRSETPEKEAGVNHNGKLDLALKLCDAAKESAVDAIKFQTWNTELIISKNTEMAEYQKKNLQIEESQYDMLKKLELSYNDFKVIKKYVY